MDAALAYGSYMVALGGMVKFFDRRIFPVMAFLPEEVYRQLIGFLLVTLYLSFGWSYFDLANFLTWPMIALTVSWVGLCWWLISRHLGHPDAPEHTLSWLGNHLLLSGSFFLLFWAQSTIPHLLQLRGAV